MDTTTKPPAKRPACAPQPNIVARENLDFDLGGDIPRHWFAGDPIKTRLFDAMSLLFPEGERFFIACVNDYRANIQDPIQRQTLVDFARQEAQHGKVHLTFNTRLASQGVKVDRIMANQRRFLFGYARKQYSKAHTLALTAAAEHLTALMAHTFVEQTDQFQHADPRVRAMYVWHAFEEVEHKAVAFDIMRDTARIGYGLRIWALIAISLLFPFFVCQIANHMLKVDGYSRRQRWGLWLRGLHWLLGPGGLLGPLLKPYLAWFKPDYHPWQMAMTPSFSRWHRAMQQSGDPIQASNILYLRPFR